MPIYQLSTKHYNFPAVTEAEPDGLLAFGGDLGISRLLNAYRLGIFPWYNEPPILWWFLSPRMVLYPPNLKVSKTMRQLLSRNTFRVTFDLAFETVMRACGTTARNGQHDTWVSEPLIEAYTQLHKLGLAHSVEVWQEDKIVGGLYGVSLGKVFYGESMFAQVSNASKYGFITLVKSLQAAGFEIIDCQQETSHLATLGAAPIPGNLFSKHLDDWSTLPSLKGNWGELLPMWRYEK